MGQKDQQVQKYLTSKQAAELLRVSPVTIRHWALEGCLSFETTPGGHRRFSYKTIEKYARDRGIRLAGQEISEHFSVLIVDDNRDFARFISELLTNLDPPVEVGVAHDGFEAGEQLHSLMPDVVLLDLMMPGVDGFSTCKRIKTNKATQHIRVIAMTGFADQENTEKILSLGAEACLEKPINAKTLLETLVVPTDLDKPGKMYKFSN